MHSMNAQRMTLLDRNSLTIDYRGMLAHNSYQDRLNYLSLSDFLYESPRHITEEFYQSTEWKRVRTFVIGRDLGYDMGVPGMNIFDKVIVHHIKPILEEDIISNNTEILLNPNNLITVSLDTHNKIHYSKVRVESGWVERYPGDTKLW